jgi:hypothetical protein
MGFCIWLTGLSGAGKTTLAKAFIAALGRDVTYLDGDEVRESLCKDLGYSKEERDANVARIAFVAKKIVDAGGIAVVACISPYKEARAKARDLIGNFVEVYLPETSRDKFGGTYQVGNADLVTPTVNELIDYLARREYLGTAFMLGRWQPWHDGHTALFVEALKEGRVCIGVRRENRDDLNFVQVKTNIDRALSSYKGRYDVIEMPNITNIVYGRKVGYDVTRVELPEAIEAISATKIRTQTA